MSIFFSSKRYTHAGGLSCAFRQWRAIHSHCRFLHGYALQITIEFAATELDGRNWVVDFGGMKDIKEWLKETFDHKTVVARDDPEYERFEGLDKDGIIDMVTLIDVGCEAFAAYIFGRVAQWLAAGYPERNVWVHRVTVEEHAGNSASYSGYTGKKFEDGRK